MSKGRRGAPVYPNIADSILTSVTVPLVPQSIRDTYVKPDTFHIYVPSDQDYESDEELKRETERQQIKDMYKNKTIKKVLDKIKNETGQVSYRIVWEGSRNGESEVVPSKGLQDHVDWALVEAFEYFKAKRQSSSINNDEI